VHVPEKGEIRLVILFPRNLQRQRRGRKHTSAAWTTPIKIRLFPLPPCCLCYRRSVASSRDVVRETCSRVREPRARLCCRRVPVSWYHRVMYQTSAPDTSILARLLDPIGRVLTPDVAQSLVKLRADPAIQARLEVLADGSVDVYFGLKAPEGQESNWIPTMADKAYFLYVRFYGPQPPLFAKTWKLPDLELVQ
jgi:Protein of unknown function (DUF1214)